MPEPSAGSSHAESSTNAHANSSADPANAPTNATTKPSPRTPQDFDRGTLTPKDQATLTLLAEQMVEGLSEKELAKELEVSNSWVSERLHELRIAISLQQGIFPPLTDPEHEALTESIRTYGVLEPIFVDEQLKIISGNNRCEIAPTVGRQDTLRYIVLRNLNAADKEDIAFTLNASRRSLDIKTRKKLVEYQLQRDAARSNPVIAGLCGVSAETVQRVRDDLSEQHATATETISDRELQANAQILTAGHPIGHTNNAQPSVNPNNTNAIHLKADPPMRISAAGSVIPAKRQHSTPKQPPHNTGETTAADHTPNRNNNLQHQPPTPSPWASPWASPGPNAQTTTCPNCGHRF